MAEQRPTTALKGSNRGSDAGLHRAAKRAPLLKGSMDIITSSKYAGIVGAFEGAGYASKGLYRPSVDCRMFSLSLTGFDPVCEDAICRVIEFYAN